MQRICLEKVFGWKFNQTQCSLEVTKKKYSLVNNRTVECWAGIK